ncbi:hypothetical protein DFJ58DRAFT_731942 [Suillus subalutaceus]|uniref:uncharacterized protein n=1 Tax=Suillus subalutaceus TaxID=48586 RepID=UPI001B887143|nr:uncharacterized protein DFJ58DRAFT_731942 [Suillus subalutaceus]KAG1842789.1 hypothetical protein DFJ58DRAFT_731942 [Suillus subalutaceus]
MSDYPLTCPLPGCEETPQLLNTTGARRHRHRYHAVPIPFTFEDRQYILTNSDNQYSCPLPGCDKNFKQRDGIEKHMFVNHSVSNDVKMFATASPGHQTTQDRGNPAVQVPAPAELFPQGVDSAATTSAADSATVRLMPSTDYLKSNDLMDAMGVCMHTALKILLCYDCGAALTSEMVAGHRTNFHPSYKACS